MTSQIALDQAGRRAPGTRRHHWWRWILGGVVVLLVLALAAVGLAIKLQPSPAPLALPARASAPAGPLNGTWTVAAGSVAGFRVRQSAVGMSSDVAGRTRDVTGTMTISGGRVTGAVLHIGLAALQVNGKPQPQFSQSLATRRFPVATFTLTRPVPLPPAFTTGAPLRAAAPGRLTLHGVTRPVTVTFSARRDGHTLAAAGRIPVSFARWGIPGPRGFGFLGSLASNGTAEILLVLDRH